MRDLLRKPYTWIKYWTFIESCCSNFTYIFRRYSSIINALLLKPTEKIYNMQVIEKLKENYLIWDFLINRKLGFNVFLPPTAWERMPDILRISILVSKQNLWLRCVARNRQIPNKINCLRNTWKIAQKWSNRMEPCPKRTRKIKSNGKL